MKTTKNKGKLNALLDVKRKESAEKFTKEKSQMYAEGITSVINSGILDNALNVGDKAPNFTLNNALQACFFIQRTRQRSCNFNLV